MALQPDAIGGCHRCRMAMAKANIHPEAHDEIVTLYLHHCSMLLYCTCSAPATLPPSYIDTLPGPHRSILFSFRAVVIYHHYQPLCAHRGVHNTYLCPCPLAPHGQPHRMPASSVSPHVAQAPYVFLHLPPQVVFNLHVRKLGGQVHDGCVFQRPDLSPRLDVKLGHDALRDGGADAEETLERALRRWLELCTEFGGGVNTLTMVPSVKLKPLMKTCDD